MDLCEIARFRHAAPREAVDRLQHWVGHAEQFWTACGEPQNRVRAAAQAAAEVQIIATPGWESLIGR